MSENQDEEPLAIDDGCQDVTNDENWMQLEVSSEIPVTVSDFSSCSSFFVQVLDDSDKWNEMMKVLESLKFLTPMTEFTENRMCLVGAYGLSRAKIICSSRLSTICFCVDSGELIFFRKDCEKIYEISPEILNFMPFQAVNCRLAGIKAPTDNAWSNIIYNKVVKRGYRQRVRVAAKLDFNPHMIGGIGKVNSYEVVLFETLPDGEEINVVDRLVELKLAAYDGISTKFEAS